jgi:hypothetical protein
VYVLGTQRGGTTLLGRLLSRLPDVTFGGEMRKLWEVGLVEHRTCGCGESYENCPVWSRVLPQVLVDTDASTVRQWQLAAAPPRRSTWRMLRHVRAARTGGDDAATKYAEVTGRLYRAFAEATGATVIIDGSKQPADAFLATQTGLDVYFLHLVRDPRGTVYSMLRRRDAASGFSVLLATARGAGLWTARHAASRRVARTVAPDRTLVLRYEDLAGNPAQILGRIADFVGVDAAAPAADGDAAIDVPVAHTPIGSGRFQAASLTVRPDEQWRESLSPMAGALTMALTLPVRLQLGHRARPR